MLWALDFPYFCIAQGDNICHNQQVLALADVHILDLVAVNHGWTMLCEPHNRARGTKMNPVAMAQMQELVSRSHS